MGDAECRIEKLTMQKCRNEGAEYYIKFESLPGARSAAENTDTSVSQLQWRP